MCRGSKADDDNYFFINKIIKYTVTNLNHISCLFTKLLSFFVMTHNSNRSMQGKALRVFFHIPCGLAVSPLPSHFCTYDASSKFSTLTEFERARGLTPVVSSIYHHPHDLNVNPDSFTHPGQTRSTRIVAIHFYRIVAIVYFSFLHLFSHCKPLVDINK